MSFTAQDVKALREKTGVGMMKCKEALTESNGDMQKAIDILREKGLATSQKKSGRTAAEGAVVAYNDTEKNIAVLLEINSETDFVGKNEKFVDFANNVAKIIADNEPSDVDALLDTQYDSDKRTVKENLTDLVMVIGENIQIRRFEIIKGVVSDYVHTGGSVGVLVKFEIPEDKKDAPEFKELGQDIAMQVAAMNPSYLCSDEVPEDVKKHEQEIIMSQMKEDPKMANKPDNVLENIAKGKLNKFFKESCLVDQEFVKEPKFDVKSHVASVAKSLGTQISIEKFVRYERGEGIEKKSEDFAEEIKKLQS